MREDVLADIGLGYPLLRQMLGSWGAGWCARDARTGGRRLLAERNRAGQAASALSRTSPWTAWPRPTAAARPCGARKTGDTPPSVLPNAPRGGLDGQSRAVAGYSGSRDTIKGAGPVRARHSARLRSARPGGLRANAARRCLVAASPSAGLDRRFHDGRRRRHRHRRAAEPRLYRPANTASRPCWAPASPPNATTAGRCSPWMAGQGR
jgi:hypothetical protein